ncbi:uncharacterized protein [Rutidosis leptorrhynchoides]|uniref:uncharacterized protein isoform X2 n=1 Tax=Rutidosis leptorrhynchoides TaxID=125765 RepID=UPI003A99E8A8
MMSGEGTSETVSLNDKIDDDKLLNWKVLEPNLSVNVSNEVSPVSSRYSSCGESEFDRYCSANSVIGTPSLCGSSAGTFHDFVDSDIVSVKSSRFGDVGGPESFSLGGKFENIKPLGLGRLGECSHTSGLNKKIDKGFCEMNAYDEMETSFSDLADEGGLVMWNNDTSSINMQSSSSAGTVLRQVETVGMEEGGGSLVSVVDQVNDDVDELSEGETSSRLEHSESEGSMYGYGTDNEETGHLPSKGYSNYLQEKEKDGEKTLMMTSSVAYGSDDLDDFMHAQLENGQDLFVIDQVQGHKESEFNEEEEPEQVMMKDKFVVGKQEDNFNVLKLEDVFQVEKAPLVDVCPTEPECIDSNGIVENLTLGHVRLTLTQDAEYNVAKLPEVSKDCNPYSLLSSPNINVEKEEIASLVSLNTPEDVQVANKTEDYELNEFYDEVVLDMEEILLDSSNSPAARFTRGRKLDHSHVSLPSRDGGPTASTSSIENSHSMPQNPYKIDGIEVSGATQKKGDVSLGERLVGVKEYTVYKLRVRSGSHQWEVERRYRDFFTLYRRLKTSFANKGWNLPSPWSKVDRESRKYFGNVSPDVVSERSVLIQECLNSILHSKFSSSLPNAMIWFISPPKNGSTHIFNTNVSQSQTEIKPVYSLGQSISLIVEIRPHKSMKQMLEAQHYTCAGCHKYFDEGKTRLWEFIQTLGWGKPRVCEYSGQVFCSSCHVNETAILPARVLHWWDFTEYPVSQLAKSYLDSIHDKPMLCVSAVNPHLFAKVPPLQHVINVRKRIGRMLPYVRCPFRKTIYKGVGSRRYVLESSDFFALKDLVDLSKGVFAALPVMLETISKKIVNHITDECLICYDVGVPCGARLVCDDPSSLIFPFQDGEVERCKSCELAYHKFCFKKIAICPCGVDLGTTSTRSSNASSNEVRIALKNSVRDTESTSSFGYLSGLLSKASPARFWGPKDHDTVIPMGSLPNSSL